MLKAEQVPDEVVEAALKKRGLMREAIADAINAWPGMEERVWWNPGGPQITLPLTETDNDK